MKKILFALALLLSASPAFAVTVAFNPPLGVNLAPAHCGTIFTSTFVIQFDDPTGNVVGKVHAWSKCAGGHPATKKPSYPSYDWNVTWDLTGAVVAHSLATDSSQEDINATDIDAAGNIIANSAVMVNGTTFVQGYLLTAPPKP